MQSLFVVTLAALALCAQVSASDTDALLKDRPRSVKAHSEVYAAYYLEDGSQIVTYGKKETDKRSDEVVIWDAASLRKIKVLEGIWGEGYRLLETARKKSQKVGSKQLTGIVSNSAERWSRYKLKDPNGIITELVFEGHAGSDRIAFNLDGSQAITTNQDYTAVIWDVNSRLPSKVLRHETFVTSAAFSPDGTRVITGCIDGTIHLWKMGYTAEDLEALRRSLTLRASTLQGGTDETADQRFKLRWDLFRFESAAW